LSVVGIYETIGRRLGLVAGSVVERIRACRPEFVVEQLLGQLPAREDAAPRVARPDRNTVLAATRSCLMAKRYMLNGNAAEKATDGDARCAVATCYDRGVPLRLSISLGSFKSPRLASAPYADWSEFLHLQYMLSRALELADIYPFGVELSYVLLNLCTEEMSRTSSQQAADYRTSFEELIRYFSDGLRPDVTLSSMPLSELVGSDEYEERMQESLACVNAAWQNLLPDQIHCEMAKSRRAHLHVAADDATIERAAKLHRALWGMLPKLAYYRDPGRVHILLRKNQGDVQRGLSQKSYRNSIVQFWVGSGCIVQKSNQQYSATILSPTQLACRRMTGLIDVCPPPVRNPNLRAVPVYV
jgi:hypothetical protein